LQEADPTRLSHGRVGVEKPPTERTAAAVRLIPYILVTVILLGGVFAAFLTANSDTQQAGAVIERPTVTPRALPTPPPREPAPTFAPDPFQSLEPGAVIPTQPIVPPTQPPAPTPTPGGPAASPTPPSGAAQVTPGTQPSPQASPAPASQASLRVGNTGGEGVYLRRTPRMDDKTPSLGGQHSHGGHRAAGRGRMGHMWEKVRAPDGTEGYLPAEFLVGGP